MKEFRYKFAIEDMQAVCLSTDIIIWYLEHYGWIEDADWKEFDLKQAKGRENNIVCALTLLGHLRCLQKMYKGKDIMKSLNQLRSVCLMLITIYFRSPNCLFDGFKFMQRKS